MIHTTKLLAGYAYKSTKRSPKEPEIVVVDETECAPSKLVGEAMIDGTRCLAFRSGRTYYFQSAVNHGALVRMG